MTREDIIRMAREAKIDQLWGDDPLADWSVELTIFAALVAAAERKACEKICVEEFDAENPHIGQGKACANAIRARGQHE